METRLLGSTGLRVSALSFGAMSFGGVGGFAAVARQDGDEARALVDQCIDAGGTLFDTADIYSAGRSEEILGRALGDKRARVLVATKLHARMSDEVNDVGLSRHHIVRACEASLRRLGTDWIDLYQVHGWDALAGVDETLRALDDLVRAGKVRYVGCSNLSGWQLMKSLAASERLGVARYSALQAYYSLVGRELEHELLPACRDQGDNLEAATWQLDGDERARLDRISARPLPYPYWHQEKYNRERMPE